MLHVRNGDAAGDRLRASGLSGLVVAWQDVLHEGPVPEGLAPEELREVRSLFIADQGWAPFEAVLADFERRDRALASFPDHDEVVLWFEHDLYDQLQLIQILDRFAEWDLDRTRLSLVSIDAFPGVEPFHGLGQLRPDQIASLLPARRAVTPAQLSLARRAWAAFRSPDPRKLAALAVVPSPGLPFLPAALRHHLEQFPAAARDGLSRTERQVLEAIDAGAETPVAVFLADQAREPAPFMGDATLWTYLRGLNEGAHPLVVLSAPTANPTTTEFRQQKVWLTDRGRDVLDGHDDRLRPDGNDRWLGGVHLRGPDAAWRWGRERLIAREAPNAL